MPNSKDVIQKIWDCWNSEIIDTVKELQNCHLFENSIVFVKLSLYRKAGSILSCISPWKSLKFVVTGCELCVSRTSFLWNFVVCLGGLVSSRGMALCHWLRVCDVLRQLCGLKTWSAITHQCNAISLKNKDHNCTAAKAWNLAYVQDVVVDVRTDLWWQTEKLENCFESYRAFVKWEVHFIQFL